MKILSSLIILVGLVVTSSAVYANDAGCGLGSLIIQKNTKLSQLFAASTNASTLTQFFGITFGTSNCSANGFVFKNKEARAYAEANMVNLKVDMARGRGENLSAFVKVLGCGSGSVSAFGNMTRAKYENIFPSNDVKPGDMINSLEHEIISNDNLKMSCVAG